MRRGLAPSRSAARRAIEASRVVVVGTPTPTPATLVAPDVPVRIEDGPGWASRAGEKLAGALDAFDVDPAGLRVLDVGASTGGFTDVLLRAGAASVVAVDVGYGQMITRLATDDRVTVVDRTNVRTADLDALGAPFDLVVADLSFISIALVAAQLARAGRDGTGYVVLVKPQFEVGRERVGRGGIVRDPDAHADAVASVADALEQAGIAPVAVAPSPIDGSRGNREFLLHGLHGGARRVTTTDIDGLVAP